MISALSSSVAGMTQAADRIEDLAIGIANPTPAHAPEPARKAEQPVKPTEPIAPTSAVADLDPTRKWAELIQQEMTFKASALATKVIYSASQDLMESLR